MSGKKWIKKACSIDAGKILVFGIVILLFSSSAVSAANETIMVSTNRYSVASFNNASVLLSGYDSDNSSFTFTAGALVVDANGMPLAGQNVYFEIKSGAGTLKASGTKITASNGLALFPYSVKGDFTSDTDPDYGSWTVKANIVSSPSINDTAYVNLSIQGYTSSCSKGYCHKNPTTTAKYQTSPRSPYSDKFGSSGTVNSMAAGAHTGRNHGTPCVKCHPGYGNNDRTIDKHSIFTCSDVNCHGPFNTNTWPTLTPSCYNANCHPANNNNLTNFNTLATIDGITGTTIYSTTNKSKVISYSAHNGTWYNNTRGVPCWICHGPMHNITKPAPLPANSNGITEYTQCTSCHKAYERHNNSVSCTVCHSQDAHEIKVFSRTATYVNLNSANKGDCTDCHQNASFLSALLLQPKHGDYPGTAPLVQKPLNHSTDSAGTKWGTYWTSTKEACVYCHGDNKHDATRLGNALVPVGSDPIGGSIGTGTVCSSCHNSTDNDYAATMALLIPDPVALKPGSNWNTSGTDHASYGTTDADCKACHGGVLSGTADISEFVHNVDVGKGGGPNCVSCHDIGASQEKVDVSKMNTPTSIHNTLNSGATMTTSGADNKRCYSCHTTNTVSAGGFVNEADLPTSRHPDGYNTPKKCTQCHDQGNFSALIVSEHNSAGSKIKTMQYATTNDSCVNCHNKTEMIISNSDPGGVKNIFASVSHYGSNKTLDSLYNTGNTSNCTYCHQNPSGTFTTEMVNALWNASIDNHTELGTNPGCINCHNSGRIHESTLTKPALTLPNSSYCQTCHNSLSKQKHNGSVDCTDCHLATNQNIHPVQYLQPGGTFNPNSPENKTSAVNCADCHQGTGLLNAPKVQKPLNHSNDPLAGQKWNNYWTTGTSGSASACNYCHGLTQHDLNALGRPSQFDGNNVVGSTISSTTYWCSSCHWQGYTSGANNYNDMVNIFIAVTVPPEITGNATYGANKSKPDYFNHSIVAKDDASCQGCHGGLTSSTNITGLLHNVYNVSEGSSSPPPNITSNQSIGVYDTRVDKYTESFCRICHNSTNLGGVRTRHHNLVGGQINPTNGQPFSCQDCHPNTVNGNQQPLYDRNCINCHNGSAFWGNTLGAQVNITRPHHINTSYDSAGIGQPAQERQCNVCHGSFIANFNDSHYIPSYNTSFMITPYADFKAYNATSGKYWGGCYACHQNSSSVSPVIMNQYDTHHGAISGWEGGIGHQKDSTPGYVCTWCHLSLDVQNATVKITINGTEETVIELRNSTLMAADIANATFEPGTTMPINGTACEKCHSVQSIHNIQVINNGQSGNGHIGNNSDCNGCHASWIAGAAPMQRAIIPSMDSITPSVVLAGSVNHITITGLNFVNDAYTSVVSVDGVTYTPTSITDTQIVVNIPALRAGVHKLQLVKGDAKSKLATLTAVIQTTVASAKLVSGSITITGANFGPKPDPAFSDLGVFITHIVKGRTATFKATVISWSENSIVVDAGTAAVNDQLTVKDLNGQASTRVNKGK